MNQSILVTLTSPGRAKRVQQPVADLSAAQALVERHLSGRGQVVRELRRTATEHVYTAPNGKHAAIEIPRLA